MCLEYCVPAIAFAFVFGLVGAVIVQFRESKNKNPDNDTMKKEKSS